MEYRGARLEWVEAEMVLDVMEPECDCCCMDGSGNPLAVAIVPNPGKAVITCAPPIIGAEIGEYIVDSFMASLLLLLPPLPALGW